MCKRGIFKLLFKSTAKKAVTTSYYTKANDYSEEKSEEEITDEVYKETIDEIPENYSVVEETPIDACDEIAEGWSWDSVEAGQFLSCHVT